MEGVEIPRSHAAGVPRELRILRDLTSHPDKNLYHANPLNENDYRQMTNLFRPVLRIMSLFGLFHPSKNACSDQVPETYRYSRCWRGLTLTLSVCNVAYMFINFVILCAARPKIDLHSFTSVVYVILLVWLGTAIVLAGLQFIVCESPNRYDRIWRKWAYWARNSRKYQRNWRKLNMMRTFYVILAVVIVLLPTILVPLVLSNKVGGTNMDKFREGMLIGSGARSDVMWTVNLTFLTFCIFATISFTSVFFVLHCLILADELKSLFYSIADPIDQGRLWDTVQDGDEQVAVIEQLRRRRLECRDIVDAANGTFDEMAFFSLFANVPLLVVIAYGMVSFNHQNDFKKAIQIIALLGSLIQVLVITVAAAWVHEYAASPKKKVHTLKVQHGVDITRSHMISFNLFLSELTSESIGISAWKFAIITKEFIATVLGLAITYIIVLVEFSHISEVLAMTKGISEQIGIETKH